MGTLLSCYVHFLLFSALPVILRRHSGTFDTPIFSQHLTPRLHLFPKSLQDAESMQDKLERARQQREERMMKQVSSESASSVMVSPRGERKKTQDLLQKVVGRKTNLSWL